MLPDLQFWEVLEPKIREARKLMRDKIESGTFEDYASYRQAVGYLKALAEVRTMAREAFDQLSGGARPSTTEENQS
ncbi:MAG: hypothetical protein ACREQ5_09200 [Candidatus Dormibacteria bacterium]